MARSTRPTHGSADDREDTPGPKTTNPGQGAADLVTGHQKLTNAVANRCDLTTLVPIGRGSGGRGYEERTASGGMLSIDPGFTGADGPPAGGRAGGEQWVDLRSEEKREPQGRRGRSRLVKGARFLSLGQSFYAIRDPCESSDR
jgi:hypothetical protein